MARSRLFLRLLTSVLLLVILFSSANYLLSVPLVKEKAYQIELDASRTILDNVHVTVRKIRSNLDEQRASIVENFKAEMRTKVSLAAGYIDYVLGRVDRGEITRAEADRLIHDGLRAFKSGADDYIWLTNYDSVLLSHPHPELAGDTQDEHGREVVPIIVDKARREGEGYHTYPWPRSGGDRAARKMSYFRHLPKHGLIVGTGSFLDDIDAVVERRMQAAVEDLRQALRNIRIARTGYVFIFDSSRRMIIHPNSNIEGTAFGTLKDPATDEYIGDALMKAAREDRYRRYLWDKPSDPNNYAYEKISWVRHVEGLDWYIASSVYEEELRSSSVVLGNRLFAVSLAVMALGAGLGYLGARRLARPLRQLADTAAQVRAGNLDARSGIVRNDEIGDLAVTFDAMIQRVKDDIATLDSRVKERTAALEEAERLKAVGQLAGGLAHDFNNLLTIILGNLAVARERFAGLSELHAYLDPAQRASRRGADITARLLAFARRQPLKPQPVDVHALVREMAVLLSRSLPASIAIATPGPDEPVWAVADPTQLENALVNLSLNSRDAMPDGGTLTIAIQPRLDVDGAGFDEAPAPGRYVEIRVGDTGRGFAPGAADRAFEPFFTTKALGSGLGLSMVYGFVKQSGGYIRIESTTGRGTTVTLLLPQAEAPAPVAADAPDEPVPAVNWNGMLALVVEDDTDVRLVMRQQLMDFGLSVIEAESGDEAMELIEQLDDLRLVVSDVVMPGVSGLTLARHLRATRPDVQVILVSGFSTEAIDDGEGLVILGKPWEKCDLATAIRLPCTA